MSLDVTIIYKKPKMVKYNATHAACGSTFMIVPDDVPTEETEWSANMKVLPHAAWVALYFTILGFLYIIVTSKLIIYNCLSYVCVIKSFILLSNHSPKSGKTVLPFSSLPL